MQERRAAKSSWIAWGLIGLGWLAFAAFFASQVAVSRAYAGRPAGFGHALVPWLICVATWFAATPGILWLARRFPIERRRWLSSAAIHVVAGAVVSVVLLAAYTYLIFFFGMANTTATWLRAYRSVVIASFHTEFLTYWAVIGLSHAIDYYRKYRERELRASQLETRLAQAQLDALRMQLHPHFLFNTLNSISVLMSEDVTAARRTLTRLSDLLRASLDNAATHEVSLREELEFLNNYLEIEQTRFQDRLTVKMNVEPAALSASVPYLILQPLVENAIKHGIAPRAEPGVIDISAVRDNGRVQLKVRDNGRGLGSHTIKGIGLSNTQARLQQLYGQNYGFEMKNADGGGLEVTISIPFATAGMDSTKLRA